MRVWKVWTRARFISNGLDTLSNLGNRVKGGLLASTFVEISSKILRAYHNFNEVSVHIQDSFMGRYCHFFIGRTIHLGIENNLTMRIIFLSRKNVDIFGPIETLLKTIKEISMISSPKST